MTVTGDDVLLEEAALWVRHGAPPVMERPHRHDDLELNLVHAGRLEYLFGGSALFVEAGEVAVFWGGTPHQLVPPGPAAGPTLVSWVHVPLTEVLSWSLPTEHVAVLLRARPVVVPVARLARDVDALFATWHDDLSGGGDSDVVMLELQAFVRRLLSADRSDGRQQGEHTAPNRPGTSASTRATAMAQFIAEHYRTSITPSDVARAVHLSPSHAMTLFRRVVGTTVGIYIARCRVAEAQRLLITTSATTVEIGHASGFASQSSFYDTFRQICGCAPGDYRRALT